MIRREFLAGLTGLSALAAAPAISFAQTPMNLGQQWDVIVIGSGLAGLSAALSASENGADRILVIEKLPVLGGHSRLSTGSFLAVSPKRLEPLGIHTSVDAVLEEMMEIRNELSKYFMVDYDDTGSIGKRYRREDEIGTPYCITVDFDTVGDEAKGIAADNCVTVRDRDTMEQVRMPISELKAYIESKIEF